MKRKLDTESRAKRRAKARRWFAALVVTVAAAGGSAVRAEHPAAAQFRKDVQPILKEYCSDCHADGARKGGVAFDEFKSDDTLVHPDLWLDVLKNTRAGLMPPRNKPQPSAGDRQKLERWIKYAAFGIDPKNPDPGRVTVRRLNRVEYRNTIRDLMGVEFNAEIEFPPDDTGYGFDNIGDVLTVSPMLLEKYLAAAKVIVAQAVPVVGRVAPEKVVAGNRFRTAEQSQGRARNGGRGNRPEGMLSLNYSEMIDKVKEIDLWYVKQLAKFLEKMEQTRDIDGQSLLHNSMIVYGSGNADGNRHTHFNLPIVMAGSVGGAFKGGRYLKTRPAPLTNLFLSMADRMGAQGIEKHGDSTGRLEIA